MSNSSESSSPSRPRYQIIKELGRNRAGGRITYLATDNTTQQQVILKRFLFAQSGSDWSSFKAYEREIQVLQGLTHPGIPRYLNSFETPNGFCMVQEYKNAQPLSTPRSFTPEEIKQIAISGLEILVYLQQRIPIVLHRDIKPENILFDEQLNVYLVDFGLARLGSGEAAMSSVAAGTFGFMAPEQIYNRTLSEATDLYGLGATLICLLTGTKSTAIDSLVDEEGKISFQHLLPKLSLGFVNWLEKMVAPKAKNRFPDATSALKALTPIDVKREPEVKFNQLVIEFKAPQLGEKLTQVISVNNSVPDTLLQGSWEIKPHENDPHYSKTYHAWIAVEPTKFQGNKSDCKVTINTSRLVPNQTYIRELLLYSNASVEPRTVTIKVDTNAFDSTKLPYYSIGTLLAASWFLNWLWITSLVRLTSILYAIGHTTFISMAVTSVFSVFTAWYIAMALFVIVGLRAAFTIRVAGFFTSLAISFAFFSGGPIGLPLAALAGFAGLVTGFIAGVVVHNHNERKFSLNIAIRNVLLVTALGMSLGAAASIGFFKPLVFLSLLGTSLSCAGIVIYPRWQRKKMMANYQQLLENKRLIKP